MSTDASVDVLMITFNAPDYVRLSLPRLLESCGENTRVWLWQNGDHEEMVQVATEFAADPRIHKFHHSRENKRLTEPTNWVWTEGNANFVSKVDDDCLLPVDWIERIHQAHILGNDDRLGALGACRLRPEDQDPKLIAKKVHDISPELKLFRNNWVQGSGYLMPRRWIERRGLLQTGESWTNYCLALALDGAMHGYLYPFLFEDHMDDPRSPNTLLHSDDDLAWRMPLSMQRNKILTLDDWEGRMRRSAHELQTAPVDIRLFQGWRRKLRNLRHKVNELRRP